MSVRFNAQITSLRQYNGLPLVIILVSALLSYIALSHQQPFNPDGIVYLNTASGFVGGGVIGAFSIYKWPFYSILIGIVGKITNLPLSTSAFLINYVLITILCLFFVTLVKELGGSRRVQFLGMIVILIYPFLNHDRDNILRDFGYYACILGSLLYFIRYQRYLSWRYAIAWGGITLFAVLFRVEGFIILGLAPFAIFFHSELTGKERFHALLKIHTLNFIAICLFLILLLVKLYKNHTPINYLWHFPLSYAQQCNPLSIIADFNNKVDVLRETLFVSGLMHSIPTFLFAGLIGIFILSFINTLGLPYLFLMFYAVYYKIIPAGKMATISWLTYLFLCSLSVFWFLFAAYIVADRYTAMICLLAMLAVPFSISAIYDNWRQQKNGSTLNKWTFPFICILLIVTLISGVGQFGPSKAYITKAGNWISQNTPPNAIITSNDLQVLYYSHRLNTDISNWMNKWDDPYTAVLGADRLNSNYLAIVLGHEVSLSKDEKIIALLKTAPIQSFQNKRGDRVLIFKLH